MAKKNPAAVFLIIFAVIAVVVGLSKVALNVFDKQAMQLAFIPTHPIAEEVMPPAPDYTNDEAWAALPVANEVDRALAAMMNDTQTDTMAEIAEEFGEMIGEPQPTLDDSVKSNAFQSMDVFFLHPSTHMKPTVWNAAFDDASAQPMIKSIALKNMATAFSDKFYAPRYRQATTGAFYDESGQGEIAMERAYQDILAAYDNFMVRRDKSRPFMLVGHSQGALHLLNLLKDRISNSPERSHLIAAYVLGWPVSIEEDLEAIGMKACENAGETGCILSWMSFATGADTKDLKAWYDTSLGLSGRPRAGSSMLCTNPLNWTINGVADAELNLGSVVLTTGDTPLPAPIANLTGATCKDGTLFVSPILGSDWQVMDLGGGNLHFYDINLFWTNIELNSLTREINWRVANQ